MLTENAMMTFKKAAPYQIFFPIGFLCSLLAVGVWLVQNLNWFSAPVVMIHSKLIMGGFIWSFIVGFLMTAIPKMTGAKAAQIVEVVIALFLMGLMITFSWVSDARYFYSASMVMIVFIATFAVRRLIKSTKKIPVFFSHVGLALMTAFLGAAYYFKFNNFMGFHLYHVGSTLLLVLGIGTRFFSFLSGLPSEFESTTFKKQSMFHELGLGTVALLFVAGMGYSQAYLGLSLLTLCYMGFIWKIYRPSDRPSALKVGVRVVALMIPLSFFMCWFQPLYYIAWFHLLFIGAFAIITYAVATRVILAHGSYSLDIEMKSKSLRFLVIFLIFGMISRLFYGFTDGLLQVSLLHLAVIFWILAISCWAYSFFKKIFLPGPQQKAAC